MVKDNIENSTGEMYDESPQVSQAVLTYGIVSLSSLLMGLLAGWLIWGNR